MARGRPAKVVPEVSDTAIRKVKKIIKEYSAAKKYCELIPERKNLFYLMDVCIDRYEETGTISYNRKAVEKIHPEDQQIIRTYEKRMQDMWLLEHGVASIPDNLTRAIAEDTLIGGKSCTALESKYEMTSRGIRKHKRLAIITVAAFIESLNG